MLSCRQVPGSHARLRACIMQAHDASLWNHAKRRDSCIPWTRCMQSIGGQLLKVTSAAEDEFVRLNLLWTGFGGEICE